MHRFVKVMGKPPHLVADPTRPRDPSTPHFLGWRLRLNPPNVSDGFPPDLIEFFEPVEQVVRLDGDARAHVMEAIHRGEIIGLGQCVARNHEQAGLAMQKAPDSRAKRGE